MPEHEAFTKHGPVPSDRPSLKSIAEQSPPSRSRQLRLATLTRRGVRRDEAAVYVGVSPSKFDELVKDGRMPRPKRVDAVAVWDVRALDLAFDALPGDGDCANPWG